MTHLFGIPINEKKELWSALCEIPGIGKKTAIDLCTSTGIFYKASWKDLTQRQRERLRRAIPTLLGESRPLGTDLKREKQAKKKSLIALGTFRGIRLRMGLPVRGQRTHSNAKTARRIR